jgi:hypothetical protein
MAMWGALRGRYGRRSLATRAVASACIPTVPGTHRRGHVETMGVSMTKRGHPFLSSIRTVGAVDAEDHGTHARVTTRDATGQEIFSEYVWKRAVAEAVERAWDALDDHDNHQTGVVTLPSERCAFLTHQSRAERWIGTFD